MKNIKYLLVCAAILAAGISMLLSGQNVARASIPYTINAPAGSCPAVGITTKFTLLWGSINVDGQPAPAGTVVEVRSPRNDVAACVVVTTSGGYGLLFVYGEDTSVNPLIPGMRDGEIVKFYVDGVLAIAAPEIAWHDDRSAHEVNLSVTTGATPTPTPTATQVVGKVLLKSGSFQVAPEGVITSTITMDAPSLVVGALTYLIQYDPKKFQPQNCIMLVNNSVCNSFFDHDGIGKDSVKMTIVAPQGMTGIIQIDLVRFVAVGFPGDSSTLDIVPSLVADIQGNALPYITENGVLEVLRFGDVNGDGVVNALDALKLLQWEVGLLPSGKFYMSVCDVNGDAVCNAIDSLFILQCNVGIANVFCPAGGAQPEQLPFASEAPTNAWLHTPDQTVFVNRDVTIPVILKQDNIATAGGVVEIHIPEFMQVKACQVDPLHLMNQAVCNMAYAPGILRLAALSATGVSGDVLLANITLHASGPIGSASTLEVTPVLFFDADGNAIPVTGTQAPIKVMQPLFLPFVVRGGK